MAVRFEQVLVIPTQMLLSLIHTGCEVTRCNAQTQMKPSVVHGIHTGCKQHQRNCLPFCVLASSVYFAKILQQQKNLWSLFWHSMFMKNDGNRFCRCEIRTLHGLQQRHHGHVAFLTHFPLHIIIHGEHRQGGVRVAMPAGAPWRQGAGCHGQPASTPGRGCYAVLYRHPAVCTRHGFLSLDFSFWYLRSRFCSESTGLWSNCSHGHGLTPPLYRNLRTSLLCTEY